MMLGGGLMMGLGLLFLVLLIGIPILLAVVLLGGGASAFQKQNHPGFSVQNPVNVPPSQVVQPDQPAAIPARYCAHCGAGLQADWTHCPQCGAPIK